MGYFASLRLHLSVERSLWEVYDSPPLSSVAQPSPTLPLPGTANVLLRRRELALARALGVGVGIFLLAWGPLSLARWIGVGPFWAYIEAGFDIFFGLLLVLPYGRIRSPQLWRKMTLTLLAASVLFVFVLVFDVLYVANLYVENADPAAPPAAAETSLYVYTDDSGPRLPFPVLNCALVFLALMQAPVVYFSRHPERLD